MGKIVSLPPLATAQSTIWRRFSVWLQSSTVMAMIFSSVLALEKMGK